MRGRGATLTRAGRVALPVSLPQENCRGSGRALGSAARRNRGHFLKKPVVQIGQLIKTKAGYVQLNR